MIKYAIELIGWVAAAMMLSAYVLLTANKLSTRSNVYRSGVDMRLEKSGETTDRHAGGPRLDFLDLAERFAKDVACVRRHPPRQEGLI